MKKKKQISVKESWYIFSIVMLAIFFVGVCVLFFQNPFVTNVPASSGLIAIGTPVNISLNNNCSNSQTLYFYGSQLPEMKIKQDVNVVLKDNQENAVVRAKVFMYDTQNKILEIKCETASNWMKNADGYFYCKEMLKPNLMLDFLEGVKIPDSSANLNSANLYSIIVTVETLPENSDYKAIWKIE